MRYYSDETFDIEKIHRKPAHTNIFELQLMVREELSRTNEDGTLMYPHLQKFMPPIPSRFVQTREKTQAAISDTYNGDGKVYAALRDAAYVSWEILSFVFTDADW